MSEPTLRKFLEESDLNDLARRYNPERDHDIFNLIFTVRALRREPTPALMQLIAHGIRDAINAHGPITRQFISSAAKRVYGRLRGVKI